MKNNIKIVREQKNLTQKDCADIFGVTLRAWQTYEQGVSEPKYEVLCKIADFFNVTLDYLLGREPPANPFDMIAVDTASKNTMEMFAALPEETRQIILDAMVKLAHAAEKTEQSISLSSTRKGQEERAGRAAEEQDGNKFA